MIFGNWFRRMRRRNYRDINPEDIFLDSANLPGFDEHHMEGRIEQPVEDKAFIFARAILILIMVALVGKLWILGIKDGSVYAKQSENNRLERSLVFANRGVIYDRNMAELASNTIRENESIFAARRYTDLDGMAHVVGYLKYPSRDSKGIYYDTEYRGRDGVERVYDELLSGENGLKLAERDVSGKVVSESVIDTPQDGEPLVLSIDAGVSNALYGAMEDFVESRGFSAGAGVIMDVHTGEILALTSYPEYDQNLITEGQDRTAINKLLESSRKPFLNRVIGGLYAPGSIIKPIVALAALNESLIAPSKKILSTGSITVPNPYDPEKYSIFRDWKEHGWTDMRESIAVSSDVYFYSIGGGYGDQKGLGISRLEKYLKSFGLDEGTSIDLLGEVEGVVPSPAWKKDKFDGDIWRLGDTYITSIGQFGTQTTPIEAVRMVAAVANEGKLLVPTIVYKGEGKAGEVYRVLEFRREDWQVVKEGMRMGVTYGSSVGLNVPFVEVAAKTGTAEIGAAKKYVHSWSTGFWPYRNPRYAFVVVVERGPAENQVGATAVMRHVIDWISIYAPEYLE